jgi:hypothetical protein
LPGNNPGEGWNHVQDPRSSRLEPDRTRLTVRGVESKRGPMKL